MLRRRTNTQTVRLAVGYCYLLFLHGGVAAPAVSRANELEECGARLRNEMTPTVGLEPTTTRLRALRSAD